MVIVWLNAGEWASSLSGNYVIQRQLHELYQLNFFEKKVRLYYKFENKPFVQHA